MGTRAGIPLGPAEAPSLAGGPPAQDRGEGLGGRGIAREGHGRGKGASRSGTVGARHHQSRFQEREQRLEGRGSFHLLRPSPHFQDWGWCSLIGQSWGPGARTSRDWTAPAHLPRSFPLGGAGTPDPSEGVGVAPFLVWGLHYPSCSQPVPSRGLSGPSPASCLGEAGTPAGYPSSPTPSIFQKSGHFLKPWILVSWAKLEGGGIITALTSAAEANSENQGPVPDAGHRPSANLPSVNLPDGAGRCPCPFRKQGNLEPRTAMRWPIPRPRTVGRATDGA